MKLKEVDMNFQNNRATEGVRKGGRGDDDKFDVARALWNSVQALMHYCEIS